MLRVRLDVKGVCSSDVVAEPNFMLLIVIPNYKCLCSSDLFRFQVVNFFVPF